MITFDTPRPLCAMLVAVTLGLVAGQADAQLYRWTDANGKVHFSDVPPPDGKAKVTKSASGSVPAVDKAKEEKKDDAKLPPEVEKRVRENEGKEKAAEEERRRATAEYCNAARDRLAQLESGERIGLRDKTGERYFMSDQQRAAEIAKTREGLAQQKCP